jgi:anti-repressor protein
MSNSIVSQDLSSMLDGWIEAERSGIEFPVPFDVAWTLAGYSNKANAKRDGLKGLQKDKEFSSEKSKNALAGRPSDSIMLSVDGMKHMCLMACTEQGRQVRQYFIEVEEKWRLVQQVAPQVASEIEILHLKLEIAKQEAIAAVASKESQSLRHLIVTTQPEHIQQKVLGYQLVEKIEYRDRVIKDRVVIDEGNTINKSELCQKYSILTKNGKPDYKTLNKQLTALNLPESAWIETEFTAINRELKRDYLPELDRAIYTAEQRQMWLGET